MHPLQGGPPPDEPDEVGESETWEYVSLHGSEALGSGGSLRS